jgi:SAM-dependent methyltransferase
MSGDRTAKRTVRSGLRACRRYLAATMTGGTRRRLDGQFQPYNHTMPNRYPWLFEFAAKSLGEKPDLRILSFGCSRGDELAALAHYFPAAQIRGLDIDPRNINYCRRRLNGLFSPRLSVDVAATTLAEPSESCDAIFCLAVLCNGDLTNSGAERCDPAVTFQGFERVVSDFARCLKPGGLLFLHVTNFRFCDTDIFSQFEVVYRTEPERLALDVLFDRENRLMRGVRYLDVGFRKATRS